MGPGTHKGPTAHPHHPVPLHLGGRRPTTRRWHGEREGGAGGQAKCSGTGVGWGWMGPCGCQVPDHPKTVRDRGVGRGTHVTTFAKPCYGFRHLYTSSAIYVIIRRTGRNSPELGVLFALLAG